MNIKEEHKNNDNVINELKLNVIQTDVRNTDVEELSNKSHQIQRPSEILAKFEKNHSLNIYKKNEYHLSLKTFKTMFKNKNKELREYKESLDRKIELLKSKINEKNILKGRNKQKNNTSEDKNLESTLKDNEINNIPNKKIYDDSLLFTYRAGNNLKIKEILKNNNYNISFDKTHIKSDLFCETFFNSKMNEKSLYSLLSLLNSNDLFKMFSLNRAFKNGIINFLKNKTKEKIINKFISKHCNNDYLFLNNSCDFKLLKKQYKKNKKAHIRIILAIKAKISENNPEIIDKKHQILYQILNPKNIKNSTFTSYSFEIIPKLKPKKFWIYKEYTSFHYDDHDKAYYNDLLQFWPGNQILINIGLITEYGILDFDNFHWLSPRILPKIRKCKISNIAIQSYLTNSESTCEVEGLVNGWLGIEQLENYNSVINTLFELFGKYFDINEVLYEDVGYYFFKITLEAKQVGECNGVHNNLGIKIKIYPKETLIYNEIKKNGLIYDEKNELNINIGDIITFYISQNK
jgi:hypothetical protein